MKQAYYDVKFMLLFQWLTFKVWWEKRGHADGGYVP